MASPTVRRDRAGSTCTTCPTRLSQSGWPRWEPGGGIISVAWADDVLWTANQVGVAAVDVRNPLAPVAMGSKVTDSWAMAVAASDSGAFLAGWNEVAVYQADLA